MNLGLIRRVRSSLILSLDLVTAIAIFSVVYYVRLNRLPDYFSVDLWTIITTFIFTLFLSGTYSKERTSALPELPIRTFFICLIGGFTCILWVYLLGPFEFRNYFGRGVLPVGTVLFGLAATLNRFAVNRLYHLQERDLEMLYLGYSDSAKAFLAELENHSEIRTVTIGSHKSIKLSLSRVKNRFSATPCDLLKEDWQIIIVDPKFHPQPSETARLVAKRLEGTPVISLADYYEKNWFMVPVQHIQDDWFLRSQGFSMLGNPISLRIKRIVDIASSLALLTISLPIIMLCGLMIKLSSKGPILFRQNRVGLQGKLFTIYKLRTMHLNAEEKGAQWAQKNDPRITFIGNFLRKTRLDELPQCWNVLVGDMSFVGPRPERPEFTSDLASAIPYYDLRHIVKPGISGWAQVIFPYGASIEDSQKKLQYELYYIKNQSLLLDLNIMIRTLLTVFQRAGR